VHYHHDNEHGDVGLLHEVGGHRVEKAAFSRRWTCRPTGVPRRPAVHRRVRDHRTVVSRVQRSTMMGHSRSRHAQQRLPKKDEIATQRCLLASTTTWTHTHTHPFNGPFPGLHGWARTTKVKPTWILLKQETVSGSGISWAICKSAPRSRQITTPAPHHSVFFYRPDALPAAQPTVSKHWRHNEYASTNQSKIISTLFRNIQQL